MNRQPFFLAAFAVVVAGKVWTIVTFGDLQLGPDTRFVETAHHMLASWNWLWDAGLEREAIPHSLWKTVGYSALIAALMQLFGDAWLWWLYGIQATMSLIAGYSVYRLALALKLGVLISVLTFLLHQWSTPFSTDCLIASNGLDGSLATIVLSSLGVRFLQGRPLGAPTMILYGAIIGFCFLLRLTYEYWGALFLVMLFLMLHQKTASLRLAAQSVLIFALFFVACVAGYKAWNYTRTGHVVTSTGGQTAYPFSMMRSARLLAPDDPASVITGDTALDRVVREALGDASKSPYQLANAVNHTLFVDHGLTAIEIQQEAAASFWRLVIQNPTGWIVVWLRNGSWLHQSSLFTGPIRQYDELVWWKDVHAIEDYYQGWREEVRAFLETGDPRHLSFEAIVQAGLRFILRLVGIGLIAALLIGTTVSSWRCLRLGAAAPPPDILLAAYGWLYFLTVAMFAVHFVELRYLSPVIGVAIVAAVAHSANGCRQAVQWLRR